MIPAVIVMVAALGWFVWETRWMTVRLPYGEPPVEIDISELVGIACAIVVGVLIIDSLDEEGERKELVGRLISVLDGLAINSLVSGKH